MNSNPVAANFPVMKAKTGNASAGTSGDDSGFDRLIKSARNDSGEGKGDPQASDADMGETNDAERQLPNSFKFESGDLPVKRMLNPFAENRVQLALQNRLEKAQGQAFGDDGVHKNEAGGVSKATEVAGRKAQQIFRNEQNVGPHSRLGAAMSGLNDAKRDAVITQDKLPDEAITTGDRNTQAERLANRSDNRQAPTRIDVLEVGGADRRDQLTAVSGVNEVVSKKSLSGDVAAAVGADRTELRSPGFDRRTTHSAHHAGELTGGNAGQGALSLARNEMGANTLAQNVAVDAQTSTGKLSASASSISGMDIPSGPVPDGRDGGNKTPEITGLTSAPVRETNRGATAGDGLRAVTAVADTTKSAGNASTGVVPAADPGAATQSQATMSLLRMIETNTNWTTPIRSPAVIANTAQAQDGKVLQSIRIHLHPVELGAVDATLRISGDKISLALKVDRESTQLSLMRDSQAIQNALRMSGYQVDEVIISGASQGQGSELGGQAMRNGGGEPGEAGDHHRNERASLRGEDIGNENEQDEGGQATAADGVYI